MKYEYQVTKPEEKRAHPASLETNARNLIYSAFII